MPAGILILGYLALVLAPLGLAWAQGLAPRGVWDELASGLGLLATAMILVEFLLLGRFRAVTGRVGSDVVMRSHQLLARVLAPAFPPGDGRFGAGDRIAGVWITACEASFLFLHERTCGVHVRQG